MARAYVRDSWGTTFGGCLRGNVGTESQSIPRLGSERGHMITMDKDKHGDKQSNAKKRRKVIMIEKIKPSENGLPERKPSRLESAALLTTSAPLSYYPFLSAPSKSTRARDSPARPERMRRTVVNGKWRKRQEKKAGEAAPKKSLQGRSRVEAHHMGWSGLLIRPLAGDTMGSTRHFSR
ncbi:hypothetical protein H0G86_001617 [Trichoderma simmonsii]|uniref:Uncharacterized protein n=1 Tax=Trichoderma simmonsii TaxID=1491479 RepID=A0A8G0PAN8_9HYPO|nr:hypothetical protein H0G86_001617 [Trichoderma simmonsii]